MDYFLQSLNNYNVEQLQNSLGELVFDGSFSLGGEKNRTVTKQIPFTEIDKRMKNNDKGENKKENQKNYQPGLYVVYAEEAFAVMHDKAQATQWVIMSDMGLTSYSEPQGGIAVNIRSLKTAEAIKDVELQLLAYNNTILAKVKTDEKGNGYFEPNVALGKGGNHPLWILAYGPSGDFSLIDLKQPGFDLSDRGASGRNTLLPLEAFLYAEQGVYRPGAKVHFDTLLRDNKANAVPNLPLTFIVERPDEVEVARFVKTGTDLGFYEQEYSLSSNAHTGLWTILAYTDIKKEPIGRLHFSVEDFVPSRVVVQLNSSKKLLIPHEPLEVNIKGQYLFGAKATGLTGMGTLTLKVNPNPFPAFSGFQFGLDNEQFIDNRSEWMFQPLDSQGQSKMKISLDTVPKTSKVLQAVIKVTLSDKGGRPEIGLLKMPVAIRPYNIGIKPTFGNVLPDSDAEAIFEIITIDSDGNYVVVNDLDYELYEERIHYTWYQPGQYQPWQYQAQVDDNFLTKGVLSTKKDRVELLKLAIRDWGQYRIEVRDPKTGAASSLRFSKGWTEISKGENSPDRLKVKIDNSPVKLGDSVSLYIEAPFEGQASVVIVNDKIIESKNVYLSPKGTTVKFTAKENWGMGVYALISAVRPLEDKEDSFFFKKKSNKANFLPKRAIGLAWIALDTAPRILDIHLDSRTEVLPGKTIKIPIEVKNKDNGKAPKKALITLAAVDEGILKLTDFATPNPENFFFGQRQLGLVIRDYYGKLIEPLPGPTVLLRTGGDAGILSRNMQALSKRSFKIISLYKGVIPLDKGKGEVSIDLPEFNGTLRLMAVAFDENRVGSQSASLLVRGPIVVEGILPRFLAPLDESFLTLSLFNISAPEGNYQLSIKSEGSIEVNDKVNDKSDVKGNDKDDAKINVKQEQQNQRNQTVSLKKEENKTIMIPIRAIKEGNGKIIVTIQGNNIELSQTFEISARYPYPYTQKTEYHLIKDGETVEIPKEFAQGYIPDTSKGLLYLSSKLPWDSDAIYQSLSHYPYSCIEQMVSRAYASLLHEKGSDESHNKSVVNQTLSLLSEKQKAHGPFALWYEGEGEGWLSAYVADFMLRAEAKGYEVPKFSLERVLEWLTKLLESRKEDDAGLIDTSYAIYVLTKAQRIESGTVRYFYDSYFEKIKSPSARAMIASALIEKGDLERARAAFRHIYGQDNQSLQSVANVQQVAPYATYLSEKATVLTLLFEAEAKSSSLKLGNLIQILEQSIVQDLKKNQTLSTQEQAWLLLASYAFKDTDVQSENAEKMQSNISIKVDQQVFNSTNALLSLPIPMEQMMHGFSVENNSKLPLWQSVSVTGIEQVKTADSEGIDIDKRYYDISGKEVRINSVKQGEQFVTVITGKATNKYPYQLLINDLLPAGFEIENARLGQGNDASLTWLGQMTKPAFTELRDDRYLAFVYLNEQNREFKLSYLVRAVTPGTYVLPGLSVEDMYVPQYFARTEAGTVNISAP